MKLWAHIAIKNGGITVGDGHYMCDSSGILTPQPAGKNVAVIKSLAGCFVQVDAEGNELPKQPAHENVFQAGWSKAYRAEVTRLGDSEPDAGWAETPPVAEDTDMTTTELPVEGGVLVEEVPELTDEDFEEELGLTEDYEVEPELTDADFAENTEQPAEDGGSAPDENAAEETDETPPPRRSRARRK